MATDMQVQAALKVLKEITDVEAPEYVAEQVAGAVAAAVDPLTLTFVGMAQPGAEPRGWWVGDRPVERGSVVWTFMNMSLLERAALRALCNEALTRLEATEKIENEP